MQHCRSIQWDIIYYIYTFKVTNCTKNFRNTLIILGLLSITTGSGDLGFAQKKYRQPVVVVSVLDLFFFVFVSCHGYHQLAFAMVVIKIRVHSLCFKIKLAIFKVLYIIYLISTYGLHTAFVFTKHRYFVLSYVRTRELGAGSVRSYFGLVHCR